MSRLSYVAQWGSSLRLRLLCLFLLVCAPLFAWTLRTATQARRDALGNLSQCAQRLVQLATFDERARVAPIRQLLVALAESSAATSLDPQQSQVLAKQFLTASPGCVNIGIISRKGQWLAAARPIPGAIQYRMSEPDPSSSLVSPKDGLPAGRQHFVLSSPHDERARVDGLPRGSRNEAKPDGVGLQRLTQDEGLAAPESIYALEVPADESSLPLNDLMHRTLENGGFTMGNICFDPDTRRKTFSVGYPVRDRLGQTQAVVFATLNWDHPSGAEIRAQLPKGASWTELDSDGRTLVQFGESQPAVWPPSVQSSLVSRFFNALYTVGEAMDAGSVRTVYASAFRHSAVAQRPLVGVITIPRDRLFAEADRLLARNLTGLGIAAVFALGLAWFGCQRLIFRPLQTLADAMTRLAAGDVWPRAALLRGRDELGWLTAAFLQMAQSLEQRERERKNASHKVQSLSRKLVQIQESERRHIARELHDEIGQSLTVAEMNLQAALRLAEQPGLARRLRESVHAVERVLDQVQDLSLNLRPSMLDDLGLEPALRWYVDRQASLAGLRADWVIDPIENRLEWLIETECFRIAQEALTNIIRHANARSIVLELTREDGHLHLRVRDDGVGFHVTPVRQAARRGESLGVLSMEERALMAGGGLQVESTPGRGTCVHAWFPLRWRKEPSTD